MLERVADPNAAPRSCMLRMAGIDKTYGHVRVLDGVDLALRPGEVHALLGENGAGKSTLMKVMFGIVQPEAGTIEIGELGAIRLDSPRHALSLGIGLVSQELSLVPQLDVARNMFLGQSSNLTLVPERQNRVRAAAILADLAPHLHVDQKVGELGMADRQLVEISRTLARGGRIVAFDEPTSSLTPAERDRLFAVIRSLTVGGKAVIYISHRMDEIRAIADRYTVMRDGRVVATGMIAETSDGQLNDLIAGRELSRVLHERPAALEGRPGGRPATPLLELASLSTSRLRDVDLAVAPGEIVGLAGLVGAGRSAILRAIFGLDPTTAGEIRVDGRAIAIGRPMDAMAAGIGLIPEDRRGSAIVPSMSIEQNFGLATHARFSRFGVLRGAARRAEIRRYVGELSIRPPDISTPLGNLSGGNQQKVVIARWLATGARIFLFDEPTRGVDIGAKTEIYAVLRRLAENGCAIVVVSSELPELLWLANRIAVVKGGRIARIVANDEHFNEDILLQHLGARL